MLKFSVTIIAQDNTLGDYTPLRQETDYVISRIEPINYAGQGISIVNDHVGNFYLAIEANYMVEDYTIIVEQNLDYIPEFPSWTIMIVFLMATLTVAIYRKKLTRGS